MQNPFNWLFKKIEDHRIRFTEIPSHPDGRFLVQVLKDGEYGEFWPRGFVWNYSHPDSCAIGLCYELWPNETVVTESFGLTNEQKRLIFFAGGKKNSLKRFIFNQSYKDIRPNQIADTLERYLDYNETQPNKLLVNTEENIIDIKTRKKIQEIENCKFFAIDVTKLQDNVKLKTSL